MSESPPEGQRERDLVQIGASPKSREVLEALKDHGHISDLMDGYRLAIALAIGFDRTPRSEVRGERKTMFAVGNLDPDGAIRQAIGEIYPATATTPSRAGEDLAEQGLEIISKSFEGEDISLAELLDRVRKANEAAPSGRG